MQGHIFRYPAGVSERMKSQEFKDAFERNKNQYVRAVKQGRDPFNNARPELPPARRDQGNRGLNSARVDSYQAEGGALNGARARAGHGAGSGSAADAARVSRAGIQKLNQALDVLQRPDPIQGLDHIQPQERDAP